MGEPFTDEVADRERRGLFQKCPISKAPLLHVRAWLMVRRHGATLDGLDASL